MPVFQRTTRFLAVAMMVCAVQAQGTSAHLFHEGMNSTEREAERMALVEKGVYAYSQLEGQGLLIAHIIFMVIAYAVLFPIGIALGIGRSKYHVPVQLASTLVALAGYISIHTYSGMAPDLYPSNFHATFGNLLFLVLVAQVGSGILRKIGKLLGWIKKDASAGFRPLPSPRDEALHMDRMFVVGGEVESVHTHGEDQHIYYRESHEQEEEEEEDDDVTYVKPSSFERVKTTNWLLRLLGFSQWPEWLSNGVEKFVTYNFNTLRWVHMLLGRLFPLYAFAQLELGIITYTGVCAGDQLASCMAHYIKGAIFIFYGVFSFLRYLGVFADKGWAWNTLPPNLRKKSVSTEMIESILILTYGIINSFIEHHWWLPNWGGPWNHTDFQHTSLALMWYVYVLWLGGLVGLLLESKRVRRILATVLTPLYHNAHYHTDPTHDDDDVLSHSGSTLTNGSDYIPSSLNLRPAVHAHHASSSTSFVNPIPAVVLIMTGISMGSHHQHSEFSSNMHFNFGLFLQLAGALRIATLVLAYNRGKSGAPSRPPTELLAAFFVTGAGILLSISNEDAAKVMDVLWMWDANMVANGVVATTFAIFVYVVGLAIVMNLGYAEGNVPGYHVGEVGKGKGKQVTSHIVIALTSFYGIGEATAARICAQLSIHKTCKLSEISDAQITQLSTLLSDMTIETDLRRTVRANILHQRSINTYVGRRHAMSLPVRGQNTKNNARTARKLNGKWMHKRGFAT
ncbi:hypothetical protein BC937DRAFT_88690 [Endogone sp. FLAS-F59071]|nr:hypothetical protein BC937DRAFT_88690 [Endogone sp. FLAS-F59071]|eukprot:RUS23302.1 hypothetical protein BC937DRAFT_88690 [Endogone sp. FLAS-F59071]